MFDISTLAVADTAPIHLKGPDGEYLFANGDPEKPVRIVIYSPGSKQFAAVEARQTARMIKRMNDNDSKMVAPAPGQFATEQAEDLASITVALENFTYSPAGDKQGQELFFAFYSDPKLGYIAQQVAKSLRDWGNFRPASNAG